MDAFQLVREPASYRDPSGFVFTYNGILYRQVNLSFKNDFETFISSGLYQVLTADGLLIPHETINQNLTGSPEWLSTLKPEAIPFISYPYEWSFGMLKDAALLTLRIALKALEAGMVLKDASAYNVQFYKGGMIFIDTLSFEIYKEGEPWIAYRQFCEHFLGPLALMHYLQLPMQQLSLAHADGIPLQYIKKMLPLKSRFNLHLYLHLHLHGSYSTKPDGRNKKFFLSKQKLINLIRGLEAAVSSLRFDTHKNVWGDYYDQAATRTEYLDEKKSVVLNWMDTLIGVNTVVDIGGNTGAFAALADNGKRRIICADGEHYAVDSLYKKIKRDASACMIPSLIDFTNPSPALGVNNTERSSFFFRASSDLALALALLHHLAIGKNISFEMIAQLCSRLGRYLIVEFVPKEDDKVQLLLRYKKDIYAWYTEEAFLLSFSAYYKVLHRRTLSSSARTLYLMQRLS